MVLDKLVRIKDSKGHEWYVKKSDGNSLYAVPIIPRVVNYKVYDDENGNPKAMVVFFADGSKEKAVCEDGDTFNEEHGISVCVTKRMMSDEGYGTKFYNAIIKDAIKVKKRNEQEKQKAEDEAIQIRKRKEAKAEKVRAKREKRIMNLLSGAIKQAIAESITVSEVNRVRE